MSIQRFLINTADPSSVSTDDFDVRTSAIRLFASGLSGGDIVQLEHFAGESSNGAWAPVYRQGVAVQLTPTSTQHIEIISGRYRVLYTGLSSVKVWMEEDVFLLDTKLMYVMNQPYVPPSGAGGGFTLTAGDTSSIDLTYVGNTVAGTITGTVIISPDANNQLVSQLNGLYANPPPAYSTLATQSITTNLVGTVFSANANISADVGNSLTIHADGLYATTGVVYTVSDTSTIDLTLAANNISGTVLISADLDNIITAHADGLYATTGAAPFNMLFTDEAADFSVGASYHAYRSPDQAVADINATLPDVTTNSGQVYILESRSDDFALPAVDTIFSPTGTDLINGTNGPITLESGQIAFAYSNGVDETAVVNYIQLAPTQGGGEALTIFNDLRWIPGPNGTGGYFCTPTLSNALTNQAIQDATGLYVPPYTPLQYSETFVGNPGGTTGVVVTDEIFISVICDSALAATQVNLPDSTATAHHVQIAIKNVGVGAATQVIHPFAGDFLEGVGTDYNLAAGKSIIITNASGGEPVGWWIVGGVF